MLCSTEVSVIYLNLRLCSGAYYTQEITEVFDDLEETELDSMNLDHSLATVSASFTRILQEQVYKTSNFDAFREQINITISRLSTRT